MEEKLSFLLISFFRNGRGTCNLYFFIVCVLVNRSGRIVNVSNLTVTNALEECCLHLNVSSFSKTLS
jgi:hypothetical protein